MREATADIVLWVESGVMLEPGVVPAVLDHFDTNSGRREFLVGLNDDLAMFACESTAWPRVDTRLHGATGDAAHVLDAVRRQGGSGSA